MGFLLRAYAAAFGLYRDNALYLQTHFYYNMSVNTEYELISVAYRSRFLFRTDAEYRAALGVSLETVANNRDSERDMRVYAGLLSRASDIVEGMTFDEIISRYASASELYLSLDWGDRSQMASRKRLCRMLFRLYATRGMSLDGEEIFRFKIKNDDERLLQAFFPNGISKAPAADIGMIALFVFGVIRPWNGENSRGRDTRDSETAAALERLRRMIELLREDMPRLGSTEKPMVFKQTLKAIDDRLNGRESLAEATPLWMYCLITDIGRTCRSMMSAKQKREAGERMQGLYMPGIWIDDADGGQSRFWIFPDNTLMAFCYKRSGMAWELIPYEFNLQLADDPDYYDTYYLIAPEGNLNFILSSERPISESQLAMGNCEAYYGENDEPATFRLISDVQPSPDWLDWREWKRLSPADPRHAELRTVLRALYDPDNPLSMLLGNRAPELTDSTNALAGRDRKYIYVHDCPHGRFAMMERKPDRFTYEASARADDSCSGLFELEISEQQPLYALPIVQKKKKRGNPELDALADVLEDAENITEAYIVHSPRAKHPRIVFSTYGVTASLDMDALKQMGALKFTRRP